MVRLESFCVIHPDSSFDDDRFRFSQSAVEVEVCHLVSMMDAFCSGQAVCTLLKRWFPEKILVNDQVLDDHGSNLRQNFEFDYVFSPRTGKTQSLNGLTVKVPCGHACPSVVHVLVCLCTRVVSCVFVCVR